MTNNGLKECINSLYITEYIGEKGETTRTIGYGVNTRNEEEVTPEFAKEFMKLKEKICGKKKKKTTWDGTYRIFISSDEAEQNELSRVKISEGYVIKVHNSGIGLDINMNLALNKIRKHIIKADKVEMYRNQKVYDKKQVLAYMVGQKIVGKEFLV